MEKVRINNDLLVKYTVFRDGQPESFVGATDITVTVTNEAYKKAIPNTFDVVGNIVNISIDAADFNLCGKYRVTLKYVRGNDIEIDALAFEGVPYTSLTGGTEIIGVEVVTVNISGDIGIAIPDNNKIDLNLDEYTIAEAFNLLYRKVISLETIIANGIFNNLQVDNLTSVNTFNYNGAPLIVIGNTAPSSAPDFVGQTYVNTTGPGTVYSAKGVASVSDWKQTSN